MIYHIYWGTSGNSGLYLDEIYQVLKQEGHNQRVFVNFYFPFDYGDKIFFKRGDVAMSKYKGIARKLFQLQEILFGYIKIIFASMKDKPELINYSHVGQSYFFIVWFLKLIKKVSGAKLIITCHDVNPHFDGKGEMEHRKNIFDLADYLLVHTVKSKEELVEIFSVDSTKIVSHPFPIMDLSKLTKDGPNPYKKTDFLFIGHLRKDKGIQFLLESWKEYHKINKDATLRICGRYLPNIHFDKEELEQCNVEFNLRYISDDDYYHYVKAARYVVLPYLQGTNSGIISTVLSLGTDVITSDLPMFTQNQLVSKENVFVTGSTQSLIQVLHKKWLQEEVKISDVLNDYKSGFAGGVQKVYNSIV